jgi:formylglycine-generating enzyme required for sulfatase activity
MITNGEFWHFVRAGGYRTEQYWSNDGWGWRKYRNMKWPFFWVQDGPAGSAEFKLRTVFEEIEMQWDWPVDVNYHEGKAYCAWKSEQDRLTGTPEAYRVITEAEHHLIRPEQARPQNMRSAEDDRFERWWRGVCSTWPKRSEPESGICLAESGERAVCLAYGSS